MSRARLTPLLVPWAVAAAAAVAAGGCEPIEQYDAGVPDAGDAGPPAALTSFAPASGLFPDAGLLLRAPLDGGTTYPEALMVTVDRGGQVADTLRVSITSSAPAVVQAVGNGVDLPPGSSTAPVLLRTFNSGSATLIASLAGGPLKTATVTVLPTVVISEIGAETSGSAQDEFIELYNPTGADLSLAGCVVQYRSDNPAGTFLDLVTFASGTVIPARGYFLLGLASQYLGPPVADATYNRLTMSGVSATVRLGGPGIGASLIEPLTLDMAGWGGTAIGFEGAPAPAPGTWGSLERKARSTSTAASMSTGADFLAGNAQDTDHNANDFVIRTVRDPQNKASPRETPP